MIDGIGRMGGYARGSVARTPRRPVGRVVQADDGAAVADDRRDGEAAGQRPGLVVIEPPQPRDGDRLAPRFASAAPFIAQLIADRDGGPLSGDRRRQRANGVIGPRASAAYGSTERLATRIEPGFLVRRSF